MLGLPIDITGLIFTYVRMRKLAKWVDLHKAGDNVKFILSNPNSIDWLLLNSEWVFPMCKIPKSNMPCPPSVTSLNAHMNNIGCLEVIARNKSPRVSELYNEVKKYTGSDCEFTYHDLLKPLNTEFVYSQIKNKSRIPEYIQCYKFRKTLLSFWLIIPELVDWCEENMDSVGLDELKILASNEKHGIFLPE